MKRKVDFIKNQVCTAVIESVMLADVQNMGILKIAFDISAGERLRCTPFQFMIFLCTEIPANCKYKIVVLYN